MSTGQMLQGWTKILCKKFLLVHIVIKNNHKKFRVNRTTFRYIFRGGRFRPPWHLGENLKRRH